MDSKITVLREINDAWRDQDMDRLASYLPGDFSHEILLPPGLSYFAGRCSGKSSAVARLKLLAERYRIIRYDADTMISDSERTVLQVPIHYEHRASGLHIRSTIVYFWTFEDEWPVHLAEYHDMHCLSGFMLQLAGHGQA